MRGSNATQPYWLHTTIARAAAGVAALTLLVWILTQANPVIRSAAGATPDRLTCVGYPEPRVFLESQTWWIQTPGKTGTTFGHMHVGACLPTEQTVRGIIGIDVRIILHDNPGHFDYWNPVLVSDAEELSLPHVTDLHGLSCPSGTCAGWSHADVDTATLSYDGRQELRLRAYTDTPDGNVMHSSINSMIVLDNGKATNPLDRRAYERGKGWYTGSGYCEASFLSPVPIGAVSGTWTPEVKIENHGASDDLAVTHHTIRLDPDFHADPPVQGTVIKDGPGQLAATSLSIDTTALADGPHKLHMRADCDDPRGSTNSGVLVIPFLVNNGGTGGDDSPPKATAPVSRLYSGGRLGTTIPVRTSWSAIDPSGIAAYDVERQLNAGAWTNVDLASNTSTAVAQSLGVGSSYRYRVSATDKVGNASDPLAGPTFRPLVTQQSSTGIAYSTGWRTVRTTSASGGSLKYAVARGAWARYVFTGAAVAWVAYKGPTRGSAKVYVDGAYRATVNLYAATYRSRSIVFAFNWPSNGAHAIKIVVLGRQGHPRIDVDAFGRLVLL
jgi:hypothetical protein